MIVNALACIDFFFFLFFAVEGDRDWEGGYGWVVVTILNVKSLSLAGIL